MISGLRPYPEMKDSGVDSLGSVPSHWEVAKLGHIGRLFKGNGASKEDEVLTGIPCIRYGDLYTRHNYFILDSRAYISEERASDYTPIEFGDILFAASGETIDEIGKSAVNLIQGRAHCGGDVIVFRPKRRLDCGYMGYATNFRPAVVQKARMGRGFTVVHIYGDQLKKLAVPLPPIQEQTDIARFLDHMDGRIQRYICAKEKLIGLLEEQKQAVIHHLVTRGVTGEAKQKTTGNPWFPRVPAHWNVMPMRRVITRSVDGPHHSPEYLDEGTPFLSARNIKVDGWRLADVKFISQSDYEIFCERVKPEVGDVLYTKGGTTGVARAVDLDYPFQVWVHVAVLKVNRKRILPRYLAITLNSPRCYEQSQLYTRGATNQDLGLGRMKGIVLPVPPMDDQAEVVAQVNTVEERVHFGVQSALREIELIRELRTRLLSDVVTGNLDVREAARTLENLASRDGEVEPKEYLGSDSMPSSLRPVGAREEIDA